MSIWGQPFTKQLARGEKCDMTLTVLTKRITSSFTASLHSADMTIPFPGVRFIPHFKSHKGSNQYCVFNPRGTRSGSRPWETSDTILNYLPSYVHAAWAGTSRTPTCRLSGIKREKRVP